MLENILGSLLTLNNKPQGGVPGEKNEGGLNSLISLGVLVLLIVGGLKLLAPKTDENEN